MKADTLILVVDDDRLLLRIQTELLKQAGYSVAEAGSGLEGLRMAEELKPAMVLLDVVLPDVDGVEICRRIKANPALSGTFVVLLSSVRKDSDEKALGLEAGADDAIARPIGSRELLARVESLLRIRRAENELKQIGWLLDHGDALRDGPDGDGLPFYGDVTELNTQRLILDAVGRDTLATAVSDLMNLLETSVAVYELNGDYAYGAFVSGWCRYMDAASRRLCDTDDNREALASGKWLCHETCWRESAKPAIESGEPTDISCAGGIHLYAVPIRAGDKIVGTANIGYGTPPTDDETLRELAKAYDVDPETMKTHARSYQPRPHFIVDVAKARLRATARLIGEIVERAQAEAQMRLHEARLQSLYKVSQFQAVNLQELLDYALNEAITLTKSKIGYIYHYDTAGRQFILNTWSKDVMAECAVAEPQTVYDLDKTGIWGEAVRQRRPIVVNDFQAPHPLKRGYPEGHVALHKFLTIPVFSGETIVAVTGVANKDTDYDDTDIRQLTLLLDAVWRVAERQAAADARERLLQQTHEMAHRLQETIDAVPEGVLLLDADHRVMLSNPPAERDLPVLTSDRAGGIITHLGGRPIEEFLSPTGAKQDWQEVQAGGRTFEITGRPIRNGDGEARCVVVVSDVTEALAIRESLRRQESLAAIGQLAGGIAHDFNNILAAIMLYAQMPLMQPGLPPATTKALQTILSESHRAANLVQQILDFSRNAMIRIEPVNLGDVLDEAVSLLRRTMPENIRLVAAIASRPCIVEADATRIHQVLMNLALNARDAMPDGGLLRMAVAPVTVGPADVSPLHPVSSGTWATLTVSDTGTGMTEAVKSHLYEPFFTTKEQGKGTGLGLAQVYGIVKQHHGFIDVETAVGVGTTFTVFLPPAENQGDETRAEHHQSQPSEHGETLLVVEDAAPLRDALVAGLEPLGYRVVTAACGEEALKAVSLNHVDVVLTDMVMPGMGGEALLRRLQESNPHVKVIAMTGYVMDSEVEELVAGGFAAAILKPFSIDDLAKTVDEVLRE